MEISGKELRGKPGEIIAQAHRGVDVVITMRGKKVARLLPYYNNKKVKKDETDLLFGMWRDREEIENIPDYVRSLRKGRFF